MFVSWGFRFGEAGLAVDVAGFMAYGFRGVYESLNSKPFHPKLLAPQPYGSFFLRLLEAQTTS